MLRAALAAIGITALSSAALAEWMYKKQDDAFQSPTHTVLVAADLSGYVAAFRCTSESDLALIYVTPERIGTMSQQDLVRMNLMSNTKILVIVDDKPRMSMPAMVERTPNGDTFRFSTEDAAVLDLTQTAAAATRRFAVAIEAGGEIVHSRTFDVRGSRKALQSLIKGCGIDATN